MLSLIIINFACVLIFGVVLSLSFADISFKAHSRDYAAILVAFGLLQAIVFYTFDMVFLFKSYPILTHLPLFFLLKFHYKKSTYLASAAILSAYLFCTPRKWIGTLASSFWGYNSNLSYAVQILITFPLLIMIIKYISPYVVRLKYEDKKILRLFISVPLIYYILEYHLTVYTNLLYEGGAAIVEFMDAAVVVIYFIFSIIYLKTLYEKKEIEIEQTVLSALVSQSKSEIEALRESQKQAAIYRHDLRHHMNYLKTCISENNISGALDYIQETCSVIEGAKVVQYSENESINLILAAYTARAKEKGIGAEINITTKDFTRFKSSDLCSLLSNAFENAIHACEKISDTGARRISLHMYSKNNRLCIDIRNSYYAEPVINQGLPASDRHGHGLGSKSMAHVVEKYAGLYRFIIRDGYFIFQATM